MWKYRKESSRFSYWYNDVFVRSFFEICNRYLSNAFMKRWKIMHWQGLKVIHFWFSDIVLRDLSNYFKDYLIWKLLQIINI